MSSEAARASELASKRARILRRTRVGVALSLTVAGLLWLASRSESGAIVLASGALLSALACYEFQRMGGLAGARWGWVLGACWLAVAALGYHTLDYARLRRSADAPVRITAHGYDPDLWLELAVVALLAVIARAVAAGWGKRRSRISALMLALWTLFVSFSFLGPQHALGSNLCLDPTDMGLATYAVALLLAALLAWFAHLLWRHEPRERLVIALWIAPLLTLPLPWLWHVWRDWGTSGLIALVVLAKVGDIAGYYVGSAIGVRHPFPRISPGKTVAGCWASFLAGTLAGGALTVAEVLPSGHYGVWGGFMAGAAVNLAAQAGDLLESWIKRRAGVKDSGTWFGPSGGVLDLVDSLLLAVPAALLVWPAVLLP